MPVMKHMPKKFLSSYLYKKDSMLLVSSLSENYLHTNIINSSKDSKNSKDTQIPHIPEPPTNCCMSGCANCVWIKYAEDLSKIFDDAENKVKEIILSKVDDPNMKAFLLMELRSMKFKK
ncbi:unnamed protein product [Nezara viridula]|uniref:Oxidoreductase-like domain-containing protein n=1 Tax=Nezara viridula TaxID=85310 RepID=A0A9P0H1K9_NEZVI|nr:unnamed protein product [Nezara viridula]